MSINVTFWQQSHLPTNQTHTHKQTVTCGHLSEENGIQLYDGAEHLFALLCSNVTLTLAFQEHLIILFLQKDQQVSQQHTLNI